MDSASNYNNSMIEDPFLIRQNLNAIISMLEFFYKITERATFNLVNSISELGNFSSEEDYGFMSDIEAKSKIAALLLTKDHLYPSEISETLRIPYSQTLKIVEELEVEGAISFE